MSSPQYLKMTATVEYLCCSTLLLDAQDPLFSVIGKAFLREVSTTYTQHVSFVIFYLGLSDIT